ncbi:hypothetical protein VNO77_39157 [Canavalia gladiata]|uniref:Uncharacterized protein n=1 Tax=Canavalia gladiata TaxID=3824 RepID=A0AAN9KAK5_CANGL
MFKKVVEAESPQRLSGPDRKKLRRSIKEKFQRASNSDLDALLPQLAVMPMLYYSFIFLLYCIVNNSILQAKITVVKLQNRVSDVLQCSCPRLRDFRNRSVATSFICLIRKQKIKNRPAPIVVGSTAKSSGKALKVGLHGKALRITHYTRDLLSSSGLLLDQIEPFETDWPKNRANQEFTN